MKRKPNAAHLALAGVGVVLAGVGLAAWLASNGHPFGAFLALAAMLGALVPLYPPDDEPDDYV